MVVQGFIVVLISYKFKEICDVVDCFMVLCKGWVSGSGWVSDFFEVELGSMIVSKVLLFIFVCIWQWVMQLLVEICDLQVYYVDGCLVLQLLLLDIVVGEIFGIVGVEGNGQDVLVWVLLGLQLVSGG